MRNLSKEIIAGVHWTTNQSPKEKGTAPSKRGAGRAKKRRCKEPAFSGETVNRHWAGTPSTEKRVQTKCSSTTGKGEGARLGEKTKKMTARIPQEGRQISPYVSGLKSSALRLGG